MCTKKFFGIKQASSFCPLQSEFDVFWPCKDITPDVEIKIALEIIIKKLKCLKYN